MKKSISNKFAYLSLILTIGMVMYHLRNITGYNIQYLNGFDNSILNIYTVFSNHIGFVCMVFFFFVSAFWFYRNINNKEELLKKYKKRLKTLLIPFLTWTIVIGIYQLITNQITIRLDNIFYHLFLNPIAGPLWYILGLLILQLFAPLVIGFKKNKKILLSVFIMITVYIVLRTTGVIPQLLTIENWWWYNNLIFYIPAYLLGTYMGIYHSDLLLNNEYNEKKYTYIGIILLIISLILWNVLNIKILILLYCFMELVGIWLILKPRLFEKEIKDFFKSNFYIYALHNPILIPITNLVIFRFLSKIIVFCGIGVVITKIVQLLIIVILSSIARFIVIKTIPKLDEYLAGGR